MFIFVFRSFWVALIGPGAVADEDTALALIAGQLNRHVGRTPVLLVPPRFRRLTTGLYALGGRNCELHVAQSTRPTPAPAGLTFPTFLPETA